MLHGHDYRLGCRGRQQVLDMSEARSHVRPGLVDFPEVAYIFDEDIGFFLDELSFQEDELLAGFS